MVEIFNGPLLSCLGSANLSQLGFPCTVLSDQRTCHVTQETHAVLQRGYLLAHRFEFLRHELDKPIFQGLKASL